MIEKIEAWDRSIFLFLNGLHSEALDPVMNFISGKYEWIPLYAFLLFLLIKKFKKEVWLPLIGVGLLIVLTDQISVKLFKDVFERYRPCHNLEIKELVHLVDDYCGGKFGFLSSHATSSFALASLVGFFLNKTVHYSMLLWAAVVSYSRIYLGVHYPSDVLAGACLGILIAILVNKIISPILKHRMSNG